MHRTEPSISIRHYQHTHRVDGRGQARRDASQPLTGGSSAPKHVRQDHESPILVASKLTSSGTHRHAPQYNQLTRIRPPSANIDVWALRWFGLVECCRNLSQKARWAAKVDSSDQRLNESCVEKDLWNVIAFRPSVYAKPPPNSVKLSRGFERNGTSKCRIYD